MQSFLNIVKSILPACDIKVLPKVMFFDVFNVRGSLCMELKAPQSDTSQSKTSPTSLPNLAARLIL